MIQNSLRLQAVLEQVQVINIFNGNVESEIQNAILTDYSLMKRVYTHLIIMDLCK